MKLNLNGISKTHVALVSLVIFSLFIGLSCAAAATDATNTNLSEKHVLKNDLYMSARYNAGTGYVWKVSPESHGVKLVSHTNIPDHKDVCGSSGKSYFHFKITSKNYYAKLVLVSPTGKIVEVYDSNMLNN